MIRATKSFDVFTVDARGEAPPERMELTRRGREFQKHMRDQQKPRKAEARPSPDAQPQAQAEPDHPSLTQVVAHWLGGKPESQPIVIGAARPATTTAQAPAQTPADAAADAATDAAQPAQASAQPAKPELPLTPLEQAVHELLGELDHAEREPAEHVDAPQPLAQPLAAATAELEHVADSPAPQPIAPPAPVVHAAELPITHYTHLVLDDGSGVQVTMRIAVRGSHVDVALKSNDEATAAALARNAGSLDEAIRGRGLDMNNFTAERDHDRAQHDRPQREREQHNQERFQLEEHTK